MDTNYALTANFGFATPAEPVIITVAASDITNATAVLNGYIQDAGVPVSTAKGFEYSTTKGFDGGTVVTVAGRVEAGQYNTTISRLTPNTQYYFKAFVDYEGNRYYGEELAFTTVGIAPEDPVITTNAAANITETSATLNGNLSVLGHPLPTAIGFTYSTTDDFSVSTDVTANDAQISAGDFSANVSGLTANTTYYFKA